jgi:hypothetical protein
MRTIEDLARETLLDVFGSWRRWLGSYIERGGNSFEEIFSEYAERSMVEQKEVDQFRCLFAPLSVPSADLTRSLFESGVHEGVEATLLFIDFPISSLFVQSIFYIRL